MSEVHYLEDGYYVNELEEIKRLNNILDEIDLIFYRMRFVEFNSIDDELECLNVIINDVRKICQNKKLEENNDINI